jgi:hypothetical protein
MSTDKNYLAEKAVKKKSATKAVWVLLALSALVIIMVVKIQLTGSLKPDFTTGLPNSDDAYAMAKLFIEPTLKSGSNQFADDKYQFAKTSDSVYVIKSFVNTKDPAGGDPIITNFKITLKYNGGQAGKQKNWTVVDMSQD